MKNAPLKLGTCNFWIRRNNSGTTWTLVEIKVKTWKLHFFTKTCTLFHVSMAIQCQDVWRILIRRSVLTAGYTMRRCTVLLYLTCSWFVTGQGQGLLGCDVVKFGTQVKKFQKAPICSLYSRATSVTDIVRWGSKLNWYLQSRYSKSWFLEVSFRSNWCCKEFSSASERGRKNLFLCSLGRSTYYSVVILLYCYRKIICEVICEIVVKVNNGLAKLLSYFFVLTFLTHSL